MRKFIQVSAFIAVLFAFSAVAASAQINYGAEVKVPFSFSVNDKSYEAGTYTVKLYKMALGAARLTIQKKGSDELQSIMVSDTAGEPSRGVELVFGDEGGRKVLTGVTTASSSYAFAGGQTPAVTTAKIKSGKKSKS